jgi:hypothetical protein
MYPISGSRWEGRIKTKKLKANNNLFKQAGAELCQAQAKLGYLARSYFEQIPGGWLAGWLVKK